MNARTVTAQISEEMAEYLDSAAKEENRSKSWVIKEALAEYRTKREEIKRMTLEGIADLHEGRTVSHADILKELEQWGKKK